MKQVLAIFGALAIVAVASVGGAFGRSAGESPMASDVSTVAPMDAVAQWRVTGDTKPAAGDLEQIEILHGGMLDRLGNLDDESARANSRGGFKFVTVPTQKGGLCWSAIPSDPTAGYGSFCNTGFNASGANLTVAHQRDGVETLLGILASDVSEVALTTADGHVESLSMDGGVIVYDMPTDQRVTSVTTVRGGKSHVERQLFEDAATPPVATK